eukprot:Blabericola_migrator_1__3403@NODE_1_length_33786_cov_123_788665_g0_i0_p13_GENE_NODE_1_length_33786_cov_123_788665_g0_i0NODE_1_length_33786_cov_123_788665_g0_i0_p13_ORF_typecomplete_len317_score30_52AP2/PF00847_20/4_4e09zfC2H2_4/PF13894_6/0_0065DUF4764/PF15961_5/0_021zfC2H2_8/PF15909_5/0_14_NODE_1_length_33786_cov_123_788665_g0_i01152912479
MGVLYQLPMPTETNSNIDNTVIFSILFELDLFRATLTDEPTLVPHPMQQAVNEQNPSSPTDLLAQLVAEDNATTVAAVDLAIAATTAITARPRSEADLYHMSCSTSRSTSAEISNVASATRRKLRRLDPSEHRHRRLPVKPLAEYFSSFTGKTPSTSLSSGSSTSERSRAPHPPEEDEEEMSGAENRNRKRSRRPSVPVTLATSNNLIAGVRFDSKELRWKASWSSEGKRNCRSFSVRRYGFEGARSLAVQARKEAEYAGEAVRSTETLKCTECGKIFLGKRGLLTHARTCCTASSAPANDHPIEELYGKEKATTS